VFVPVRPDTGGMVGQREPGNNILILGHIWASYFFADSDENLEVVKIFEISLAAKKTLAVYVMGTMTILWGYLLIWQFCKLSTPFSSLIDQLLWQQQA
jgi:hypothetical protein